jgi:hypothetical protein
MPAEFGGSVFFMAFRQRLRPRVAAFRQRLGELDYIEGQNTIIDYRWSDQLDRLPSLAAALTELQ